MQLILKIRKKKKWRKKYVFTFIKDLKNYSYIPINEIVCIYCVYWCNMRVDINNTIFVINCTPYIGMVN